MTQEVLAEAAGVDTSFLSQVERGVANPSLGLLAKLASALNVSATTLFETLEADETATLAERLTRSTQGLDADSLRLVVQVAEALARK